MANSRSTPRTALALALASCALVACNRYEYVRPDCPSTPPSRSAIAWRHVVGTPGTVRVTVTLMDSLKPVSNARVQLTPDSGSGVIRFDQIPFFRSGVAPGGYTLDVMRIGAFRASRHVEVVADSALEAVAVMSPRVMMLDGCGYVLVPRKKPWWKWW